MSISLFNGYRTLPIKPITFPGGEIGVQLPFGRAMNPDPMVINAKLRCSDDVMLLAMTRDALTRAGVKEVGLFMPYIPYARQDRVCTPGESLSVKVFADMINAMRFDRVTVVDPHSEVATALIDRVRVVSQVDILQSWKLFQDFVKRASPATFVSPDAGANKKTAEIAKLFGHYSFIRADKLRELSTGKIIETRVYCDRMDGRLDGQVVECFICDDICDGGRTFIELAKALREKGAAKVHLFVTHGIFSQGTSAMYPHLDSVWTTNSLREEYLTGQGQVFCVFDLAKLVSSKFPRLTQSEPECASTR